MRTKLIQNQIIRLLALGLGVWGLVACTVVAQPAAQPTLNAFATALEEALVERDFVAMPALMGKEFTLAYWRSEGVEVSPAEAVGQLRRDLSAAEPVQFVEGVDLKPLLGGAGPLATGSL